MFSRQFAGPNRRRILVVRRWRRPALARPGEALPRPGFVAPITGKQPPHRVRAGHRHVPGKRARATVASMRNSMELLRRYL